MTDQLPLTKMTDDQLHDLSTHLVELLFKLKKEQKNFADARKNFNEEIKDLKAEINETAKILREQEAARDE